MDVRLAAALNLRQDALAAEVCAALAARGVRAILLKGASFAAWLYTDGTPRTYGDVDLLIDPDDGPVADEVLSGLGFAPKHPRAWAFDRIPYGRCWRRDGREVDLHRSIWGIGAASRHAWALLSTGAELQTVGGRALPVLSPPARTMHVALHAAQHRGSEGKPLRDLARAIDQVDADTWEAAVELARRLGAAPAMAAGLRLDPRGVDLAAQLGLPAHLSRRTQAGLPASAEGLAYLTHKGGRRAKLLLTADILFPPRDSMRARYPLARRGGAGLALAYGWRVVTVAGKGVAALVSVLRRAA